MADAPPDLARFVWVFFGLRGRLGQASFFLAGLLIFVSEVWLFTRYLNEPQGTPESDFWAAAFSVFGLISLWCNCALTAKRFHDFGKPGVLSVISILIGFLLFIVLAFIKGDPGPNAYGERPDQPA